MNNYLRTDLAVECPPRAAAPGKASVFQEETRGCVRVTRLTLDEIAAARLGKETGRYITLSFGKPWLLSDDDRACLVHELSNALSELLPPASPHGEERSFLVVGLGNRRMTADAVGPLAVEKITVTAHLPALDPTLFTALRHCAVAAFSPGVLGDTGIESALSVKAVAGILRPAAILVIDALAARAPERLASTIQLSNSGIRPGSGIGNDRPALDGALLGCPVIAVGVPLVVDSSALVCDALEKAGITEIPAPLRPVLENGRSFFVSLKEADAAVEALSSIIAEALDAAFSLPPSSDPAPAPASAPASPPASAPAPAAASAPASAPASGASA